MLDGTYMHIHAHSGVAELLSFSRRDPLFSETSSPPGRHWIVRHRPSTRHASKALPNAVSAAHESCPSQLDGIELQSDPWGSCSSRPHSSFWQRNLHKKKQRCSTDNLARLSSGGYTQAKIPERLRKNRTKIVHAVLTKHTASLVAKAQAWLSAHGDGPFAGPSRAAADSTRLEYS